MKKATTQKRLSKMTWLEIRGQYERGESMAALARKHGIERTTIWKRADRENWLECGALKEIAIKEAQAEAKREIGDAYKTQAIEANNRHLGIYRDIQDIATQCLDKLDANLAEPNPAKREHIHNEIRALGAVTSLLKASIEGERASLRLDKIDLHVEQEDGFDRLCNFLTQVREERLQRIQISQHKLSQH